MLSQKVGIPTFFLLCSIPLCRGTRFCLFVLIYSSTDGHLGCFQILAIVNSAAMNMGVHKVFELVSGFFRYIPRSGKRPVLGKL